MERLRPGCPGLRAGLPGASAQPHIGLGQGPASRVADLPDLEIPTVTAEAIDSAGADAVLAATVFHFGTCRISEVKESLAQAGHPVR